MQRQVMWQWIGRILVGAGLLGLTVLGAVLAWSGVQTQLAVTAPAATITSVPVPSSSSSVMREPSVTSSSSPTSTPTPSPTALAEAPRRAPVANVPNVRVSAGRFTAHSEVTLAQNPRNPQNMVGASKMFTDNENYVFRIGTYVTFDGGQSWTDNGQLPGLDQFGITSDPIVVFDGSGNVYVEVLAANRQGRQTSALYLYKSTDGGRSWANPVLINDDTTGFNDKEWLAADTTGGVHDGTLYTTWVQIVDDTYRIRFARSTDGGSTWSQALELAVDVRVIRQGPVVSVGAGGEVYVLWSNLSGSYLESSVSRDGGASFKPARKGLPFQNVDPLNGNLRRGFVLAAFAADPQQPQTLYVVWDDGRLGNADILFARSTDGGITWSQPVMINGVSDNDQFQPWIAVNNAGELYVQWFDRRDDPGDLRVHTYAARSTDSGVTWSELRVTDVASDPTVGLPFAGDAGFYGDYQALVADDTGVQLFWNETRDGSQEVYTARISPGQWPPPYVAPTPREAPVPQPPQREAD